MATSTAATPKNARQKEREDQLAKFKDVTIERRGQKIVLPEGMNDDTAIEWMTRWRDENLKDVGVHYEINCYPLDGAVALMNVLDEMYGWVGKINTPGFFSDRPPTMVGVPTGVNTVTQVPWGRLQVPSIAGYLETGMMAEPRPQFILGGVVKQRHSEEIKLIVENVQRYLREHSIYKGSAVKVDFSWRRDGEDFSPTVHAPEFIDLKSINDADLIFGEAVQKALRDGLFVPIEQSDACRKAGIALKRGVLLEGPYGTGKTLTALVTAAKAVRNGWTFVYLKDARDLATAVQFCSQYTPAVLFAEDVDQVVGQTRDDEINQVLNTLDGVDSKKSEIIVVLTTNFVQNINQAMIRPGRMDVVVPVRPPDAAAAERLVRLYGRDLLDPTISTAKVGKALAGKIPAVIAEILQRAKSSTIARRAAEGKPVDDITGHVTESDILDATSAMELHLKLLEPRDNSKPTVPELIGQAIGEKVGESLGSSLIHHIQAISKAVGADEDAVAAYPKRG